MFVSAVSIAEIAVERSIGRLVIADVTWPLSRVTPLSLGPAGG